VKALLPMFRWYMAPEIMATTLVDLIDKKHPGYTFMELMQGLAVILRLHRNRSYDKGLATAQPTGPAMSNIVYPRDDQEAESERLASSGHPHVSHKLTPLRPAPGHRDSPSYKQVLGGDSPRRGRDQEEGHDTPPPVTDQGHIPPVTRGTPAKAAQGTTPKPPATPITGTKCIKTWEEYRVHHNIPEGTPAAHHPSYATKDMLKSYIYSKIPKFVPAKAGPFTDWAATHWHPLVLQNSILQPINRPDYAATALFTLLDEDVQYMLAIAVNSQATTAAAKRADVSKWFNLEGFFQFMWQYLEGTSTRHKKDKQTDASKWLQSAQLPAGLNREEVKSGFIQFLSHCDEAARLASYPQRLVYVEQYFSQYQALLKKIKKKPGASGDSQKWEDNWPTTEAEEKTMWGEILVHVFQCIQDADFEVAQPPAAPQQQQQKQQQPKQQQQQQQQQKPTNVPKAAFVDQPPSRETQAARAIRKECVVCGGFRHAAQKCWALPNLQARFPDWKIDWDYVNAQKKAKAGKATLVLPEATPPPVAQTPAPPPPPSEGSQGRGRGDGSRGRYGNGRGDKGRRGGYRGRGGRHQSEN